MEKDIYIVKVMVKDLVKDMAKDMVIILKNNGKHTYFIFCV